LVLKDFPGTQRLRGSKPGRNKQHQPERFQPMPFSSANGAISCDGFVPGLRRLAENPRYSLVPSDQHNMSPRASMAARITTIESIGVGALPYLGLPE
jgi:hypothetical protein